MLQLSCLQNTALDETEQALPHRIYIAQHGNVDKITTIEKTDLNPINGNDNRVWVSWLTGSIWLDER